MRAGVRHVALAALVGFVVGVGICLRFDLVPRSQAVSLFGSDSSSSTPPTVQIPD